MTAGQRKAVADGRQMVSDCADWLASIDAAMALRPMFPCPRCGGSGEWQPGRDPQVVLVCPRCAGRG